MILREFNQSPIAKINKINKLLNEQFGIKVQPGKVSLDKLQKINESANTALYKIRGSAKKFHLDPDYAKYLGLRDITETIIKEGYYPQSEGYKALEAKIAERVKHLMDCGYTTEEACSQCMNEVRMDGTHCYEDGVTKPMVMAAVKAYEAACGMSEEAVSEASTDLNDRLLAELAKECGVELEGLESYDAIEEKLNMFAEISGKTRDAVVGFLNGLDEQQLVAGIQMFGKKIANENAYNQAAAAAKRDGKKEFEFPPGSGKMHPVTMDGSTAEKLDDSVQESMFDDIIGDMLNEEVDVEQAEVVMAVRALADDIQDQIERLGRMMNEDVPAIADQMRGEMGASQAQSFADATNQVLAGYMEAAKSAKAGMDQQVAQLSGEEQVGGLGDTAELGGDELGGDELGGDLGLGEPEDDVADVTPAAAGPEDEPLGRAEI